MTNQPQTPEDAQCFGKHWDATSPQCKGGLDPLNKAPDGTNNWPQCAAFAKCAALTVKNNLAKRAAEQVAVVKPMTQPFHSVVRGIAQGAQAALVKHVTQPAAPVVQQAQPMAVQPHYGHPAPVMVHPSMAAVPYMAPMNYQAPGMQMPAYLTVQEPVIDGQHWLKRLGFNIVRSMVKAACHTGANFADHNTFNQPVYYTQTPAPEPQNPQT